MRSRCVILGMLWAMAAAAQPGVNGINALETSLRMNPGDPTVLRSLGWALMEYRHDTATAYQHLAYAVEIDPTNLTGHKLLALAAAGDGRVPRATAEFKLVLGKDPTDVWMWVNFGKVLMVARDFTGAHQAYLHALQLQPGYQPALQALRDWSLARGPQASITVDSFASSDAFTVAATTAGVRSGFGNIGQIAISGSKLSFRQGEAQLLRSDLSTELELSASPALDLRFQALATGDSTIGPRVSGSIGAERIRPNGALRFSAQARTPVFPDNFQAALLHITSNQLAFGFDQTVFRNMSLQGVVEYGEYSNRNHRVYTRAQISQRLPLRRAQVYARLGYQRLSFSVPSAAYFSPANFEVIRPQLEFLSPLSGPFALDAKAELLYLPLGSRFGESLACGGRIETKRFTFHTSGTYDFVPVARAWSGRGLRMEGKWTF